MRSSPSSSPAGGGGGLLGRWLGHGEGLECPVQGLLLLQEGGTFGHREQLEGVHLQLPRVEVLAVPFGAEVEVGARGAPGGSDVADELAGPNLVASLEPLGEARHVGVARLDAAGMADEHLVAETSAHANQGHRASVGRIDGRARPTAVVGAVVRNDPFEDGVQSLPVEVGRDGCAGDGAAPPAVGRSSPPVVDVALGLVTLQPVGAERLLLRVRRSVFECLDPLVAHEAAEGRGLDDDHLDDPALLEGLVGRTAVEGLVDLAEQPLFQAGGEVALGEIRSDVEGRGVILVPHLHVQPGALEEALLVGTGLVDLGGADLVLEGHDLLGAPGHGHRKLVSSTGAVVLAHPFLGLEDTVDLGLRNAGFSEGQDEGAPLHLPFDDQVRALESRDAPGARQNRALPLLGLGRRASGPSRGYRTGHRTAGDHRALIDDGEHLDEQRHDRGHHRETKHAAEQGVHPWGNGRSFVGSTQGHHLEPTRRVGRLVPLDPLRLGHRWLVAASTRVSNSGRPELRAGCGATRPPGR